MPRIIPHCLALLTLFTSSLVTAAVTNTTQNETYTSLAVAYSQAVTGDVLVLDDGTYEVPGGFSLSKSVTVKAANIGAAVLNRGGTGPVITVDSDATVEGLRLTGGSIGIELRDAGAVTGTFSDIVIHNMTIGINHDNSGGTDGTLNVSNLTMFSVARAIVVNDGGKITVNNAIFARIFCTGCETYVAQVSGANVGADSISINNYLLQDVTTFIDTPLLVSVSNEVTGSAEFADLSNHNYARLVGAVGEGVVGARIPPVPRKKMAVKGNGQLIANADVTPSTTDLTDFGNVHGGKVTLLTIENEGYSEAIALMGGAGNLVQLAGTDAEQFTVLAQPTASAIAARGSKNFELYYAPTTTGTHGATVTIPNDTTDTSPYRFSIAATSVNQAPVAVNDVSSVDEDGVVAIKPLTNDADADNDSLKIVSAAITSGAGTVAHSDTVVTYTPAENFNGATIIAYTIMDNFEQASAEIAVTVVAVNDPPRANNDVATIVENKTSLIDVLANDVDAEGSLSLLDAKVIEGAGSVRVSGSRLEFTPAPWSTQAVKIEYRITDGSAQATATVSVKIVAEYSRGTIPVADISTINRIPLLKEALQLIPLKLVDGYEESISRDGDVTQYALTGKVSLEFPASINLPAISVDGADVLVYSEEGLDAEGEPHRLNSFFVKISLYEFLRRMFATTDLPAEVIGLVPDVPIIIGYSDLNLDETALASLPVPVQSFFSGIFDTNFGIPIFDDTGSLNLFIAGFGYDAIPDTIRRPLRGIGIDAQFVEDNLGVGGRLTVSGRVNSLGQILDVIAFLIPGSQPAGFSLTGMPSFEFALVTPGLSLPGWLQSGTSQILAVQGLNFEPNAAGQMRYFMGIPDFDIKSGELAGLAVQFGMEGLFRVNLPNLLNADSLRDAAGSAPLDVRGRLEHDFAANLEGDGVEANGSMTGTLMLVNEWVNPLGIPGVSIGNATLLIGGGVSAGAKLSNAGVGIDVDVGLGGEFSCLNDAGERLGSAKMAGYLALKVGVAVPVRGFGLAVQQPAMSFVERIKCGARVQLGAALGLPDTVVATIPDSQAKDTIRALNQAASGSIKDFVDQVLETPLKFAPLGAALDQFRFAESELYLATPGIELPGHIDGIGFRIAGGAEYRNSRANEEWISIGEARFEGNISEGIRGALNLADYNIADLIIMEDVEANIDLQLLPPQAELGLKGRQKLLDLDSATEVSISLHNGILLDSTTTLGALGTMSLFAESVGSLEQWPPVEPFDMRGSASLAADPAFLANSLHSVAGNITGAAADAYRTALNRLSGELASERNLRNEISRVESEVRQATDRINSELRPRFDFVREKLFEAERVVDYFYNEARWYERSHDSRSWWDWGGKAYDWGRAKVNWALYEVARRALPAARSIVSGAETALNAALYKVTSALEPRLNALRVALGAAQAAKSLVFVAVQGLEAANNAARAVSDALRDANSLTIHNASAQINSLNGFLYFNQPADMDIDFELAGIGLRCRSDVDFFLFDPVSTITSATQDAFTACVQQRTVTAERRASARAAKAIQPTVVRAAANVSGEAPANDSAQFAQVISDAVPVILEGSTLGATVDPNEYIEGSQSGSIWWRWQPTESGYYEVSATGGDTGLQIHDAGRISEGAAISLLAADIRPVLPGKLVYEFESDQTYLIAVTSQLTDPGAVSLIIEKFFDDGSSPQNDRFVDAFKIDALSGTASLSNLRAGVESGESTGDALPLQNTLWWRYTAPKSGAYSFDTLTSEVDTIVRAYKPAVSLDTNGRPVLSATKDLGLADLPWLESSDRLGEDPSGLVSVRLFAGETIWLSVGTQYDTVGKVQFNWRYTPLPESTWGPDHFGSALPVNVTPGTTELSSIGATNEMGEPLHGQISNHASIWLDLIVPQSGSYIFNTRGSTFDTVLSLYKGETLSELVPLADNDNADSQSIHSQVRVSLIAGKRYLVAIAGREAGEGQVNFNVLTTPENDDFAGRVQLATAGGAMAVDLTNASLQTNEPDYAVILASDQAPTDLLASFDQAATTTAGDNAPPSTELAALIELSESLYDDVLRNFQENPIDRSLWWRYRSDMDGDLVVSTVTADVDTSIFGFSGAQLTALKPIAFADDTAAGFGSELRMTVSAGEDYVIALAARQEGVTNLTWQLIPLSDQKVANDHPDGALPVDISLNELTMVSGSNVYARTEFEAGTTTIEIPGLASAMQSGRQLWWRVTSEQAGTLTIDTTGSDVDTALAIYQLRGGELVLATFNDNYQASSSASRARVQVSSGQSVYVAVDSVNGTTGTLQVNVLHTVTPSDPVVPNDLFSAAETLSGTEDRVLVDTRYVQYQPAEPQIGTIERPNMLWYQWQAPVSGSVTISTAGSEFDTVLALYEGAANSTLSNIGRLASNDDVSATNSSSRIDYLVEAMEVYFIGVAGKRGVRGALSLALNLTESTITSLPGNSSIGAASELSPNTGITTELRHINSNPESGSSLVVVRDATASSRWYQWQAPDSGSYRVSTEGSEIATLIEVYQGDSSADIVLIQVDSNTAGDGNYSAAEFTGLAGQRYFIRITSSFAEQGQVSLAIEPIGETSPELPFRQIESAEAASVPARIVADGTYRWRWRAPRNGLVLLSLQNANDQQHRLEVYRVNAEGVQRVPEVGLQVPTGVTVDNIDSQFLAEGAAEYEIVVNASSPVLGNSSLSLSYQSGAILSLDSAEVGQGVSAVSQLLVSQATNLLGGVVGASTFEAEIMNALKPLIESSGSTRENLVLALDTSEGRITLTLIDSIERSVLLAIRIDPDGASRGANLRHTQIGVGAGEFSLLGPVDDSVDTSTNHPGLRLPVSALSQTVRHAFVSVVEWPLGMIPEAPATVARFQARALYELDLLAFNGSAQQIDIEPTSVVDGVQVRLPVDAQALLDWLDDPSLTMAESEAQLARALEQGLLQVVSADSVEAMLRAEHQALTRSDRATVNLTDAYLEFTTEHFSSFALIVADGAGAIDDRPDDNANVNPPAPVSVPLSRSRGGGCSVASGHPAVDPTLPLLLLLSMIYLWTKRRSAKQP